MQMLSTDSGFFRHLMLRLNKKLLFTDKRHTTYNTRPSLAFKMTDLEQCYCKNESFVFRRIENETILVPIKDNVGDMGSIYSLNEIGAFIWEQLDGMQNLKSIKDKILDEYEVSPQEAEADLRSFVVDLVEIDAVHLAD